MRDLAETLRLFTEESRSPGQAVIYWAFALLVAACVLTWMTVAAMGEES